MTLNFFVIMLYIFPHKWKRHYDILTIYVFHSLIVYLSLQSNQTFSCKNNNHIYVIKRHISHNLLLHSDILIVSIATNCISVYFTSLHKIYKITFLTNERKIVFYNLSSQLTYKIKDYNCCKISCVRYKNERKTYFSSLVCSAYHILKDTYKRIRQ